MVESQYNEPRQLQLELSLDIGNAARLGSILGQINSHLNNDAAVHKELPFGASVVGLTAEHVKLLVVRLVLWWWWWWCGLLGMLRVRF